MKKYIFILLLFFISCAETQEIQEKQEIYSDTTSSMTINKNNEIVDKSLEIDAEVLTESAAGSPQDNPIEITPIIISTTNIVVEEEETQPEQLQTPKVIYGEIAYELVDTMSVGETSNVSLVISHNINKDKIISEIKTFNVGDNIIIDSLRISNKMRVTLIDPTNNTFTIVPLTSDIQIIEEKLVTKWSWNVVPLKKGKHNLILSVDIIQDGTIGKNVEVYNGFINVFSNESIWSKIGNFFNENWKYFLSTLFLPLFIYIYNKKKKKKTSQ